MLGMKMRIQPFFEGGAGKMGRGQTRQEQTLGVLRKR